jgi:hypothetical protein
MRQHLSLDDFKKWMEQQEQVQTEATEPVAENSGYEVQSKIPLKRLRSKIEIEDGDEDEVCEDFLENGGTVIDTDGKRLMVEVDSGSFCIHRMYVERS